ncbi:MAG TPA: hypothetical protein VHD85_01720 [Terracidiphilus sp.]|nr:hypothetical protein [Terracidiphilus sp.]
MADAAGKATVRAARPTVRGTQLLVEHLGAVLRRPLLVAIELGWRWFAAVPILWAFWREWQKVLAAYPLDSSGFNNLDAQNPWVAVVQLGGVWDYYEPHIAAVLRWLLPLAALAWIVVSAVGRNLILMRMERGIRFRPFTMIALHAALIGLLAITFWGWFGCIAWVSATHIAGNGEPDLVGYAMWVIFLSLGFFSAWALVSWTLAVAPLLALLEKCSAGAAIWRGLKLGVGFTSKLAEINLVMGIVKIALVVLAMVFSAAPLPFSDELGPGALRAVTMASVVFFFVANDIFQVVRLKAFVAFWHIFRGSESAG